MAASNHPCPPARQPASAFGRVSGAAPAPQRANSTGLPYTRVTLAPADVAALRRPGGSTRITSLWPVDQTPRSTLAGSWTAQRARQAAALAATGLVLAPTLAAPAAVFADGGTVASSASVASSSSATSSATPGAGVAPSATSPVAASAPAPASALPAGPTTTTTTAPASAASPASTTASPGTSVSAPPQVSGQSGQPITGVQVSVLPQVPRPAPRPPQALRPRAAHRAPRHSSAPTAVSVPAAPTPAAPASTPPAVAATPGVPSGLPPTPLVAANLGAPAALSSAVTKTAFAALRLPLFLLPIYQAAGDQYGVPWQVLAAINEVETNYGFDDRTSSAGAIGWMQFEPSSWQGYGVDVAGQTTANPYNPADAIYAAAAYLKAAGGQTDVRGAIFAYNHSSDYVASVMLRAQLIESFPQAMINALTSLGVGRPPVPLSSAEQAALATTTATPTPHAPAPAPAPARGARRGHRAAAHHPVPAVSRELHTRSHAPVLSVRDGRVVALGNSPWVGNYVTVADVEGNQFTYSHLQRVGTAPAPRSKRHGAAAQAVSAGGSAQPAASTAVPLLATEIRLAGFRPPLLRISPARAGAAAPRPGQWSPLYRGELMSAGSVLGQAADDHGKGVLRFALRPAGSAQTIDPSPYLTAWNLREKVLAPNQATADARAVHDSSVTAPATPSASGAFSAATQSPVTGGHQLPGASGQAPISGQALNQSATAGTPDLSTSTAGNPATATNSALRQVKPRAGASDIITWGNESMFFESQVTLSREVLKDRRISVYAGGRRDIAAHRIDRRVLAVLEYLADSGLHPAVSALVAGHGRLTANANVSEHASGNAVDIAGVNGINIQGHQGGGSITDITIQRLLALPDGFVPHQIISLMTYNQATNTLSLPGHANHVHIGFRPASHHPSPSAPIAQIADAHSSLSTTLDSREWQQLTAHLQSLGDPPLLLPGASAAPQITPANG